MIDLTPNRMHDSERDEAFQMAMAGDRRAVVALGRHIIALEQRLAAKPTAVLIAAGDLSDADFARLRALWESFHGAAHPVSVTKSIDPQPLFSDAPWVSKVYGVVADPKWGTCVHGEAPPELCEKCKLEALLEAAWGIIANAGGGDWNKEIPEWRAAASRWRDRYHKLSP